MRKGRPMKYDWVLRALEDDELYTPAAIADLAMKKGLARQFPDEDEKLVRTRVRISMGRYGYNHGFPRRGDGIVSRKGQSPTPGWWGWRWKQMLSSAAGKGRSWGEHGGGHGPNGMAGRW